MSKVEMKKKQTRSEKQQNVCLDCRMTIINLIRWGQDTPPPQPGKM
jgi:hypothetical protein